MPRSDCVLPRVREEGFEECVALWNADAQFDRRKRDGGALMDRQRSAGYFEVRRMSAYGTAAVGAKTAFVRCEAGPAVVHFPRIDWRSRSSK